MEAPFARQSCVIPLYSVFFKVAELALDEEVFRRVDEGVNVLDDVQMLPLLGCRQYGKKIPKLWNNSCRRQFFLVHPSFLFHLDCMIEYIHGDFLLGTTLQS
jgi:hypothetical protein